jgi:hypothetical protein
VKGLSSNLYYFLPKPQNFDAAQGFSKFTAMKSLIVLTKPQNFDAQQ